MRGRSNCKNNSTTTPPHPSPLPEGEGVKPSPTLSRRERGRRRSMFKFRCMHCDKKIVVPTEFSGRHVRCPGCAQSTIVPFPSPEELEAAEEVGFHIRANPSAALSSRTCKACGATMPQMGPCINCGADPGEGLKAAFDASLATILAAPVPTAAL